jgi:hypothetical protein
MMLLIFSSSTQIFSFYLLFKDLRSNYLLRSRFYFALIIIFQNIKTIFLFENNILIYLLMILISKENRR